MKQTEDMDFGTGIMAYYVHLDLISDAISFVPHVIFNSNTRPRWVRRVLDFIVIQAELGWGECAIIITWSFYWVITAKLN